MPVHFDSTLLGALRCFDMAGRHLSFTRAAEAMSLTQARSASRSASWKTGWAIRCSCGGSAG